MVLATTGYSAEQLAQIEQAAKLIPIFRSANMSLGVNVLLDLVRRAAALLGRTSTWKLRSVTTAASWTPPAAPP